jgi:hypothetical protein
MKFVVTGGAGFIGSALVRHAIADEMGVGWLIPRALAGRLRPVRMPLRALRIEMTFGREGRAGTRIIRLRPRAVGTSAPSAKALIEGFYY